MYSLFPLYLQESFKFDFELPSVLGTMAVCHFTQVLVCINSETRGAKKNPFRDENRTCKL